MDTVTAQPEAFLSVEYFCEEMRKHAGLWTDLRLLALAYVKVFAKADRLGAEAEALEAIRNILAAADIVRAEFEAAGR